ncbi:hypothetical protein MXM53_12235, partial [Klebsiella quasipneumoniae]|uniref:hypothetical protein n=1 Tax=Klebsiella quasipneumoniae TaxID=1463165 RepID=UPI002DB76559
GLTALSAEFTIGEGELMAHDVPLGCAPDEYDDLISGTCSHLPLLIDQNGVMDVYSAESLTPGHERNGRLSMPKWPPEGYCESSESAPTAAKNRPTNSYNEW